MWVKIKQHRQFRTSQPNGPKKPSPTKPALADARFKKTAETLSGHDAFPTPKTIHAARFGLQKAEKLYYPEVVVWLRIFDL